MKPVAHTLLALLIVLSLMSAFTGIYILSKGFNPTLSIPFESTKTLYKPSILIDMDIQSELGPDQVKVSQLPLTTHNLYNKLHRIDSHIIRSKNHLLIFRNHLKSGTLLKSTHQLVAIVEFSRTNGKVTSIIMVKCN